MTEYVLCFPKVMLDYDSVLLIEKKRPDWQKGRWNLVGGKVEAGESHRDAAVREFQEETGLFIYPTDNFEWVGKITGEWGSIYCYRLFMVAKAQLKPGVGEDEKVFWASWDEAKDNERLMPNLRVIIPLMLANVQDWLITDDGASFGKERHSFTVEVPSTTKTFN